MRTILWFGYFWAYLIALMPSYLRVCRLEKAGRIEEKDALVAFHVSRWAKALLRVAGVTVTVTGLEHIPQGSCVFASNHQGNFDIPILLSGLDRPHPLIGKQELKKIPLIRDWMQGLGCVFLDRDNARKSMETLKLAAERILEGYSVIIFPEGTRSKGDAMGEFKAGAFRVASKTQVPVVPIAIDGSHRAMESNKNWITPAQVRVHVLPPVATEGLSKEELRQLPGQIQEMIRNHLLTSC